MHLWRAGGVVCGTQTTAGNISAFLLFNSEISPVYYPAFYFAEFELEAA